MKIVIAPDSFKESLSAKQVGSTRLCVKLLKSSHSRSESSHTCGIHEQSLK